MFTGIGDYVTDLDGNKLDISLTEKEFYSIRSRDVQVYYTTEGTRYELLHNHVYRTENGKTEMIY